MVKFTGSDVIMKDDHLIDKRIYGVQKANATDRINISLY